MVAFMMEIVISPPGIFAPLRLARSCSASDEGVGAVCELIILASFRGSEMTLTKPSGYTHRPGILQFSF